MALNQSQFRSCAFPAMGKQEVGPRRPLSVRIDLQRVQKLQDIVNDDDNDGLLSALMCAAWALLLRCYTGLSDVSFAFEDFGRSLTDPKHCNLIGSPNAVAFMELATGASLKELVQRAQEVVTVKPAADYHFNTSVLLRYNRSTGASSNVQPMKANTSMSDKCNLRLLVKVLKNGVSASLEYRNSFISTENAKNVASTFDHFVTAILDAPDTLIENVDAVSQRNRRQIDYWNSDPLVQVMDTIHNMIAKQVASLPDVEAVCSWDGSFTYKELDEGATRLAAHLVNLGVGREVVVPLCFEKSKFNVVAMLAVLKAGGAFMPLDPGYPRERIEHLIAAVDAKLVLCSRRCTDALTDVVDHIVPLDADFLKCLPHSSESLDARSAYDNVAYIIPTSGTTGQPKLSVLEHGNFCTGVSGHAPALLMSSTQPCRVLQFAAHSFDASVMELLSPLVIGGTVCIPDEETRLNDIAKAINDMKVTWAQLTPTFVRFLEPSMVPTLSTIALIGEAMSEANLQTWSKINLVNGYGPSECAVASVINSRMTASSNPRNIGFPISSHAFVVDPDDYNRLVPVGCVGELLTEGYIVARGYLNDEAKTAKAFIRDPSWAGDRQFRGYLTGDLVTQNSDGSLNYVGRKDSQVKLHGQRVELLEIEHQINADALVKHCLVVLPKEGLCKDRLIATVTLADETSCAEPLTLFEGAQKASVDAKTEAIRANVSERLPFHMVPTLWIVVTIPLLASGKLDRKTVSQWLVNLDPASYRNALSTTDNAPHESQPSTEIEKTLINAWARVLNIPKKQVPLNRSFLSLGGDSISSMQVMSFCRKRGVGFSVQDILRSKSITQLAGAVTNVRSSVANSEEAFEQPFGLSPIQSLWFSLPNQGHGHFNQSFYLTVTRPVSAEEFRAAIQKLVVRHSMLRARFERSPENNWQQRITQDVASSYRFRHQQVSNKQEITFAIENCQQCLEPTTGPLLAADLFEYGTEQRAFLVGHHLVIDLVSWRVLLEELEEILIGGSLLPPSLPFQTWSRLQEEHAETLEPSSVLPPLHVHPLDLSYWGITHGDNTYGNASHESFEIDAGTTSSFLNECHAALKTEPVDVLLASLIYSWSMVFHDRPLPTVFNEGHGREPWSSEIDVSRTVGWFTTVYPISVSSANDAIDAVCRVKDFRRAIPGNGRPYMAAKCLTDGGNHHFSDHWPMEMSFNYLGQYQQLERADALLRPLESMAGETREAGGTADVGHDAPRFGLFEISAIVFQGRLRFAFTFNRYMQHQDKISQWVFACQQCLVQMTRELATHTPEPTMSDFPLLNLTDNSFHAMMDRLNGQGISGDNVEQVYPVSNMQNGLLLSQTKDAGCYAAVAMHEISLSSGCVSWQALADAWKHVVKRHAALRTVFLENISGEDSFYDQVVLKQIDVNIAHFECCDEHDGLQIFRRQQTVAYDNDRQPPHRLTLCSTSTGRLFSCLEISHAIMDGHSMSLLYQDLARAYVGALHEDGPLYSDYIAHLRSQPLAASLGFWKSYLNGAEVCSFPVLNDGKSDPKVLKSMRLGLGNMSSRDLQTFCSEHGITLSNVFHAAWAMTLCCYVGANDVTFGYLTSARDASGVPGVEDMVGPLINTLVCRIKFSSDNQSLLDVLQEIQRDHMNSLPHRHTSLAEVQHALELAGASLFNTALSYRKLPPQPPVSDTRLKFREIAPTYDPTEYPVSLNIEVSDEAVFVDLDYWTDHLSSGQASNVADTFVQSLENIVAHSGKRFCELDHLSGQQLQQILSWNVMPPTLHECVHHRFAEQVLMQPNAPAIRGFDGDYSYGQLDAAAERLAHYLVELGVGPEVYVPTCFDKSSLTVIADLAVLKAGGAVVPLDANHPKQALESRIEDTESQIVLTSAARSELFEDVVPDVVIVDSVLLDDLQNVSCSACTTVQPHNPAFIIFTSGSTGKPKGVILEHAAMVTSAYAHGTNLGIGPGSRFLQFASYTFDNSLEEMFTTLQRGGCICVPSEEQRMNNLAGAIAELDANFMDLTPTVAALLDPTEVPTIKSMALGGEALTKAVVDQWSPYVHVHGQYGPSEASINSAWKDFKDGGEPTNIGRAIGSVCWIVDPENRNRLVPIGCKGELLIEGPILSRGYLNDPAKTANAFIQDPEWAVAAGGSGRRFYCTGDLVHYTSNGEMMYLGRKDSQVKLNGQRIELGEIEHHLKLNLSAGAQSAVELITTTFAERSTKSLAAFLCLSSDPEPSTTEVLPMSEAVHSVAKTVEVALSNALPAYYVPSMFVPVSSMPMTTSGKLDRKALRDFVQQLPAESVQCYRLAGKSGRAPSGHVETTLARLWEDVLRISPGSVGMEDSFFRLCGDSISAMRLVTACRKEDILLTVADIFACPKLCEMVEAAVVLSSNDNPDNLKADLAPFELVPEDSRRQIIDFAASQCLVSPDAIEDTYPTSRLQEGLIALSTKEPGAYVAEVIYRLPRNVNLEQFRYAWEQVVNSEAILRTRIIHMPEQGFLQIIVRESIDWREIKDLHELKATDRHLPAQNGGRLTSYAIAGRDTDSPCFVWTAHHAVYDGFSLPRLLDKVESLYCQASVEVSTPFSGFIKYLTSIDQEKSDEFWISTLGNFTAPQYPPLPSPGHVVQASSQLDHHIKIARRPGMGITMPSLIRAAWGLLLATYSGSDDVFWGETNSGREVPVPGIEDIIGPTIATSPTRLQIDRQASIDDYLQEVQKNSAAVLPFQFAGLQHIQKLSSDAAMACDFQSLLSIVTNDSNANLNGDLWTLRSTGTIGTNFFNYALVFNCTVAADGVEVEVHYDPDVLSLWLVQRHVDEFEFLLHQLNASENNARKLNDLQILNSKDRNTIAAWNNRPSNTINKCVQNVIFQEQVMLRPEAQAIDGWDTGTLSYRELDERATRIASRLISLGIKPKTFIPLCFDKSGWAIVAMLAVLKVGAAFVPLDFEAPPLRLREIVHDVGAQFILCATQLDSLCQSIPCRTLVVDRTACERQPERIYTLPYLHSDTPAYVIFTSGSTGKPKGAVIHHSSFVSMSVAYAPAFQISRSSRVLQFASYAFDASLIEILSTLMMGGCICVPDQASRANDLSGVINRMAIDWAVLTPSVIRTMTPSQVPGLSTLALVGEAMSQQDLFTWAEKVTLLNGYGPTECSVGASVNVMTKATKPNNIGKAVNVRAWIVSKDNHHILAPVGAIGELLLEGAAVGAGYLKDPEKTAGAFVEDANGPLSFHQDGKASPRRFYKTGDLVRYNEDGTMLYLGRKDSQSKVRGQRIELTEVEHHLIDNPSVRNALASVPVAGLCAKRLVGVVLLQEVVKPQRPDHADGPLQLITSETASYNINTIREDLCERLPSYMVPSIWIAISKFPLMPSGKMDRRRVVQWLERMDDQTYRTITSLGLKPEPSDDKANSSESKLRSIIAKILNMHAEDIKLNLSFLHQGGDSIAAMQVASHCRALGLTVTAQEVIRSKTLAQLATKITATSEEAAQLELTQEYDRLFDLTPIQRTFFDTVGPAYNHFNQSAILRLGRSFELQAIRAALATLVKIHPMLRSQFFKADSNTWRQRIEEVPANSFRLGHHRITRGTSELIRPIVDESQASMDIVVGPTFSADLFDIEDTFSQAIALIAHHLVVDVVSWNIIIDDLQNLLNGTTPPPQSLPFPVWSQQQAEQAKQDSESIVFPATGVPLPDFQYWGMDGKANLTSDVINEELELSAKDSMLLLGAHDALSTEPLDVFIAALLESFRLVFPDRPAVVIHNEGHGREPMSAKQDLSRTVGWFTTLTPVHLPVAIGDPTDIINTICWVKDLRERVPNKGRRYFARRVLTEEGQQRFAGHWPAEVTFNYLGRMQNLNRKDALLQRMDGISTNDVGDNVPRFSLFEITALVTQGTIKLSFDFNKHMTRQSGIRKWISKCRQCLVDAVEQLLQTRSSPSLSDFKLLPLSYNGISKLPSVLPPGATVDAVEDIYPASSMQQGMLLSQMKHPEFYAYHCISEIRSVEPGHAVDPKRIAEAWQIVVLRHQSMRTVFVDSLSRTGIKDQVVFKEKPGVISWIMDCADEDAARVLRAQMPVDYREMVTLHRLTICQTKTSRVWVRMDINHAICDGGSMQVLLRDLSRAYAGMLSRSEPGPLYSDFIAYSMRSQAADIKYWKSYLSGIEPCNFPVLQNGKPGPHETDSIELHLKSAAAMHSYCRRHGITLSNLLQLSWALILHCYIGASDVSFGVLASGRDIPVRGIEEAAGCFVNMLVCRIVLTDEMRIQGLLEQLQADSVNALSHQSCSFADVQHELHLPSLFNTIFTYQRRQFSKDPEETALVYENVEAVDPGEFHITVNVDVSDEGTTIDFSYWKDRVCPEQAQNMAETFERILESIVADQDSNLTVGDVEYISPESLSRIMEWNAHLPPPVRRCVHDLIYEQGLLRPSSAIAVHGWDGKFTYQELDRITDRLSAYLVGIGIGAETFIPLLFEKSCWAIVAMIAAMKAGGAYIPLDPKHPPARLRQLVSNTGSTVVLCSTKYLSKAEEIATTAIAISEKCLEKLSPPHGQRTKAQVTPDNAVYCLFTSGTTGTPKGTVITHQAFCTSSYAFTRHMRLDSTSRAFQFCSYTFDVSCAEILAALIVGATVCVPSEAERINDPAGAIRAWDATWAFLTPSVLSTMQPQRVPCLKTLVAGGEAVPHSVIAKWGPHVNLINGYGPTEASVFAVTCEKSTPSRELVDTDPGTIGIPSGCRTWIVHPRNHNKLMSIGAIGELLLEGYTIARGYLGDEVKTTNSFVQDPTWAPALFIGDKVTRIYKSGDLARYNADGSISYLGRKDNQIKFNGQRIELGEIESHVRRLFPEDVQSAVDLVSPASYDSTKALAVFFCTEYKAASDSAGSARSAPVELLYGDELLLPIDEHLKELCKSLENGLAEILPSYMIPSIFIPMTRIPWTTAGKLDRNYLRNLVQSLDEESLAPYRLASAINKRHDGTDTEQRLRTLFCSILNLPRSAVGLDDNFIRLGGDSVAAMKLVSAAQSEGLELSVIDIFTHPKLSDLALRCDPANDDISARQPIEPFVLLQHPPSLSGILDDLARSCRVAKESIQDAYPASPLQEAFITLSTKQPGAYVAQHILSLSSEVDVVKIKAAWDKAVQEIDILRTRIVQTESGAFIQVVVVEDPIRWLETSTLEDAYAQAVATPEHNGGRLAAYTLVQTTSGERYLVWTLHHALFDGWSIPIVLSCVEHIYQSGFSDSSCTPYTSFVRYLQERSPESSDRFWKESLAHARPFLFPQESHTASEHVPDSQSLTHVAHGAAHRHADTTLATIIRAAWALVVSAYTRSDDVVFGETLTGRDIDLAGIIDVCGPTLTTVPTRVQVNQEGTVLDLLQAIAKTATERIPYQHAGLAQIKRIDPDTAAACNFRNLLAIQTASQQPEETIWKFSNHGAQSNYFTYPLVLECTAGSSDAAITAYYDANAISQWQVQRILYQLDAVISQLNSVNYVRDIRVFSEQDLGLVQQWNSSNPTVVDNTIPSLFLQQATLRPHKEAVAAFDGDFSYAELRDLATRLAVQLMDYGAGPESLIPLCMEKSRWAIVAIMGVLLAGAAYVPISPDHPASRHKTIIQDCNASIMLCSPTYEHRFSDLVERVVPINEESVRHLPLFGGNFHPRAKPNNVCYVLYTSGSTGLPKGVVIEHQAIASSSAAICQSLNLHPDSRVFQFGNFVFDVTVMEILTTLTCGATICIPSHEERTSDITGAINRFKATWTCLTPSVANVIKSPTAVPSLQTLAAGAEPMTPETISKWGDGLQLLNAYGPTEGSIVAVANNRVSKEDPSNIGIALSSGRAWVVDPEDPNALSPVGAVGELVIEGPLLARGYLNNKTKTDEFFIDNPRFLERFNEVSSGQSRVYRTGDLVQYAPSGDIRYVGRKDNQVKLAGQRLELGEIEHHLQTDPHVRQAVVLMPKHGPGKRKLIAVVSLHICPEVTSSVPQAWNFPISDMQSLKRMGESRDRLSNLVPPYMVPSVFVIVHDIPTLASSKLDRKQILAWFEGMDLESYRKITRLESKTDVTVATTTLTSLLQRLWATVLNLSIDEVKLNESWLVLGGDSISAMQLLAKARKEGINLTINQVLKSKSILHLANTIDNTVKTSGFDAEQMDTPFELSPIQRFYFEVIGDANNSHFNQSFTLRLSQRVAPTDLNNALDTVVKHHSMLRARFSRSEDETWQQTIPTFSAEAYTFRSFEVTSANEIPSIISDTQKSFDIVHGPVFAANIFNSGAEKQVVFLAAHHLVVDMVSWRVILNDLEELLQSGPAISLQPSLSFQIWTDKQAIHTREEPPPRPALTTQPADFSFWGMTDRQNVYGDVERDSICLAETVSSMALNDHKILRTDIVDFFIAAILHSFSRVFINRQIPTVFNETHGREPWADSNIDLSRTVGWFTAMYPVHVSIKDDEDNVIQTVREVKDARRKISDNGRGYFAHRYLTKNANQQHANNSSIEVLFNYLGKMQQLEKDGSMFQPIIDSSEDEEIVMSDLGPNTARPALFEISAMVVRGRIQFTFMYNRWMKNQKGIRRWIAECERTLEDIVHDLADIEKPQPTLSDYPLLPLDSYEALDKVLDTLPPAGVSSCEQVEDIYPVVAVQEGMILGQIKDSGSYLSYSIFEVKAKLDKIDVGKLAAAWQKVVRRHPSLRTIFLDSVYRGGVFDQAVLLNPDSGVLTLDCGEADLTEKLKSVEYINLNGKRKPRLPHQFTIIHTSNGRVIVKMEINHALVDGGSHTIILRDLKYAYDGLLSDDEGPLYSDYIKFLRELPVSEAISYWKEYLHGLRPCLFPTKVQHSSEQKQLHSLLVDFDRFDELQKIGESSGVTFSNIMLTIWSLCLRHFTKSSDVCFGYLTSGRNVPVDGIQDAVGAFINMLVSRVDVTQTSSLADLFQTVQSHFVASLPHQHCSLAQFQHDLGLSGRALFNTAVSIQNHGAAPADEARSSSIEFEDMDAYDPSEFSITVNIEAGRHEEGVLLSYWTHSVSDECARDVASTMAKILNAVLLDSTQTIAQLDVAIAGKPEQLNESAVLSPDEELPTSNTPDPAESLPVEPTVAPPALVSSVPDWGNLIRSIVSEMVPQIVDQVLSKNKITSPPAASTIDSMTHQMAGMLGRRASQSLRTRPNFETASIRSRRLSAASDTAESRINVAADMVAAAGVMASEALKSVSPDFVEKKLLTLWSELLDMVEDSIEKEDSFFTLGGDSIIAMRLVGAAREEGLAMTVADVFKNPTFADMARVVRVAGEVIDQVMSQAGDPSPAKEGAPSTSKPSLQLPERTISAWKDFVSDHASDGGKHSPPAKSAQETNQMLKKWQGFQRTPSVKRQMPTTVQTIQEDPAPHQSISLLGDPNVDSVISKVQTFKGGIVDVLPVTDFQSLAITGTLLESRWMLNYFHLSGPGPLDLRKLKQSVFRLVQAFDILRTVFVPFGGRFLQVVLRKLQPEFSYQETSMDLDTFTEDLRQRDCEHGPRLGETFVKFIVAKQKKTEHYRIFMRISHAQYDGYCLSKILHSLEAGYNGLPVSNAPSFGNYVRESAKTVTGAQDHWKEILRGSKMTEVVHRYGPNYQRSAGSTMTLKQKLTLPSLSMVNITTATVMKAAWASTLARLATSSDVVFGNVLSCRNGSVPQVEGIVGPCLNMVPVRVVFRREWTVLDLLQYLQDQQVSNMDFECLGFREITRQCTDWPDWTSFSSVIQHNQNIHDDDATLQLGGIEYKIGAAGSQEDFADISIVSTSKHDGQVEVQLTYVPNSTITPEYAQNVFGTLCTTAMTFAQDPETLLPSPSELTSGVSTAISEKARQKPADKHPPCLPTETGLPKQEVNRLANRLLSVWEQLLRDEHGNPAAVELGSDFFELGGDIMGLAQVASILDQEGFSVRVEDLIDKCVFVEQVGLLAVERRKQVEQEEQSPWGEKGRKGVGKEEPKGTLERRESGLGALVKRMGLKRKGTHSRS